MLTAKGLSAFAAFLDINRAHRGEFGLEGVGASSASESELLESHPGPKRVDSELQHELKFSALSLGG